MPRPLPLLADRFDDDCRPLKSFYRRLELNHSAVTLPNLGLTLSGLELSYELLYLKVFLPWEQFQQDVFARLLMGFQSNGGVETFQPGIGRCQSLQQADLLILNGRSYKLWHDPVTVIARCDVFFDPASSYFRTVIASSQAALRNFSAIRHRIAHSQDHARTQFDNATMTLAGRRYPNASAGKFLRDRVPGSQIRWFEHICSELSDITHQLC